VDLNPPIGSRSVEGGVCVCQMDLSLSKEKGTWLKLASFILCMDPNKNTIRMSSAAEGMRAGESRGGLTEHMLLQSY
jgi:hypothetical protein